MASILHWAFFFNSSYSNNFFFCNRRLHFAYSFFFFLLTGYIKQIFCFFFFSTSKKKKKGGHNLEIRFWWKNNKPLLTLSFDIFKSTWIFFLIFLFYLIWATNFFKVKFVTLFRLFCFSSINYYCIIIDDFSIKYCSIIPLHIIKSLWFDQF